MTVLSAGSPNSVLYYSITDIFKQLHVYFCLTVNDHTEEATTLSSILLTDRTLSLRAHKEVSETVLTSKCQKTLDKYNVTRKEYVCICWVNCPWRPLTEEEIELEKEFGRIVNWNLFLRQIYIGTFYSLIFVFGVTGMSLMFIYMAIQQNIKLELNSNGLFMSSCYVNIAATRLNSLTLMN